MKLRPKRLSSDASSASTVTSASSAPRPATSGRPSRPPVPVVGRADGVRSGPNRVLTTYEVTLAPPRPRTFASGRRRGHGPGRGASGHLVVGGAAALVVGLLSATTLLVRLDPGAPLPPALTISPAMPPSGGFAVAADDMDETLRSLVDSAAGRTVSSRTAPGGERVVVDSLGGPVRRMVQSAGVLVDTPSGPALVHVDVRRASVSCARPVCVRVVRTRGASGTAPSTLAVVVDAGVEVRAQAWAGARDRVRPARLEPALTARALVELAGDPVWRH